jgi:hypothetical protein
MSTVVGLTLPGTMPPTSVAWMNEKQKQSSSLFANTGRQRKKSGRCVTIPPDPSGSFVMQTSPGSYESIAAIAPSIGVPMPIKIPMSSGVMKTSPRGLTR